MRAAEIELLLPEVIRRTCVPGSPMAAMLAVMEGLHEPSEAVLADLPAVLDPLRTPERFVSMLSRWVDLERLAEADGGGIEPARMRLLVAMSAVLGRRRGTRRGLLDVLTLATGVEGFLIDEAVPGADGHPRPFHIKVTVPAGAADLVGLVGAIVEQEKPAHLTAEVVQADEAPAPAPGAEDEDTSATVLMPAVPAAGGQP
ncbi:hypothetical protein GCM10009841_06700 [Microlunatus panaciterrae]|uniref:Phage tail-like protein n=1 Tax=Microlunatus panaciterrae TaxID=400768 RepID=A0ABS2RKI2_9ACTN|nr:phage tail protein [Microlunatus panaciterrae]MBM7798676.1 phage tail-like protein [Microlunatus panaciterrae]